MKDLLSIGYKIEQFLSFVCLAPIQAESVTIIKTYDPSFPPERYVRLWQLGEEEKRQKKGVMPHQALISLAEDKSDLIRRALETWIEQDGDQELAAWLYLDNQESRSISSGRLVAIMQAVELAGRTGSAGNLHDRMTFKVAAERAANVLCEELGEDYDSDEWRSRFRGLLLSSNKRSFRDNLKSFASAVPNSIRAVLLPDEPNFIARVVRLRNTFVHPESETISTDEARRSVGELTYRLLALFAAHRAAALGLEPRRAMSGIANSSIGRAALHFIKTASR